MLFREHLLQEENDSETEDETEGDTPSIRQPHHAAAQARMTDALVDTLPGMGNVCGMLPGVQPEEEPGVQPGVQVSMPGVGVQVSMHSPAMGMLRNPLSSSQGIPQGSATSDMAADGTVPTHGTSAASIPVLEVPGTDSPLLRSAVPSPDASLEFPESQETIYMESDPRRRHAADGVQEPGVQVLGASAASGLPEPAAQVLGESAAAADQHAAAVSAVTPPLSQEGEACPWVGPLPGPSSRLGASDVASDAARTAAGVQEPGVQVCGESAASGVQGPGVQVFGEFATTADQHAATAEADLTGLSQGMGASGPASDATRVASGVQQPVAQVSGNSAAQAPQLAVGLDAVNAQRDATCAASGVQQPGVQVSGDSAAQVPQVTASGVQQPGVQVSGESAAQVPRLQVSDDSAAQALQLTAEAVKPPAAAPSSNGMDAVKGVYPEDAVHARNVQRARIPNLFEKSRKAAKRLLKQLAQAKARKARGKAARGKATAKATAKKDAKPKAKGNAKEGAKPKAKGKAKAKSKAKPKAEAKARAKRGTKNTFAGRLPPQNPDLLEIHNTMKTKFQELSPELRKELAAFAKTSSENAYWKVIHVIMGDKKNNLRRRARQGPGVSEGPGVSDGPGMSGRSGTAKDLVEDCHTQLLDKFKSGGFQTWPSTAPSSAASSGSPA